MTPCDIDADGKLHMASLETDYATFKQLGYSDATIAPAACVETSFAEAAAKQLGPYRPQRG